MLKTIRKVLDKFLETLLIVVMTVLVLDVLWQVFTRKVLGDSSQWTEELAKYLMVWVGMLGASVALYRGAHLGIDYFVGKLSARKRLFTEIIVFGVIAVFSAGVMVFGGFYLVQDTLELGQLTPALGIKKGYVYLVLPLSGIFLVIYSVEFLIEKIIAFAKHKGNGIHPATEVVEGLE